MTDTPPTGDADPPDPGFRLTAGETSPVVVATGEIDLANADEFGAVLTRAAADSTAITVDLSGVTYCDSAALRKLFAIAPTVELTLVVPAEGQIATLLRISGLDKAATVTVAG